MKNIIASLILSAFTLSVFAKGQLPYSLVTSVHHETVLVKVNKDLVGGTLVLEDENGKVLTHQFINSKKVSIDFSHYSAGAFTIRISKDGHTEMSRFSFGLR